MHVIDPTEFDELFKKHEGNKKKILAELNQDRHPEITPRTLGRFAQKHGYRFPYSRDNSPEPKKKIDKCEVQEIEAQFKKKFRKPGIKTTSIEKYRSDDDVKDVFEVLRSQHVRNIAVKSYIGLIKKGNPQALLYYFRAVWGLSDSCNLTQNNYNIENSGPEKKVIFEPEVSLGDN